MTPQPGDLLCYPPTSLFGRLIVLKTWSVPPISHVEVYLGDGVSFAARNEGVNYYPLREDYSLILRPTRPLDGAAVKAWCDSVQGQGYDFIGVVLNFYAVTAASKKKMWCSELATRLYRAGGLEPFHPGFDADRVAPASFLASPVFERIAVPKAPR